MRDDIVGICQFSFLGSCDWIGTRGTQLIDAETLSARIPKVYDETRLRRRFQAFEAVCLPSLRAQTDQDFSFWVLTSPELPEQWLDRLCTLCETLPQAQIIMSTERSTANALRPNLLHAASQAGRPVIQFRLDDDDALSRHYVARLRADAVRFADMPTFAISYAAGLIYGSFGGEPLRYFRSHQSFVSAGTAARMNAPGRSIFAIAHTHLPRRLPSFIVPDAPSYIQTRWDVSDTAYENGKTWNEWQEEIDEANFRASLEEEFPFLTQTGLGFAITEAPM